MKKNLILVLFAGFLLFVFGAGTIALAPAIFENNKETQEVAGSLENKKEITVSIALDYGNGTVQDFADEKLPEGNTAFDALKAIEQRHAIALQAKEFTGLGMFVESIGGVKNTQTAYWQYWVNGEYSTVGSDQYELKEGDQITWKLAGDSSGE